MAKTTLLLLLLMFTICLGENGKNRKQICQKLNLHLNESDYNGGQKNTFMVDPGHKLAFCRHGKVWKIVLEPDI